MARHSARQDEEEKKKEYLDNVRNKIYKGFRHVHSASFQDYVKECERTGPVIGE